MPQQRVVKSISSGIINPYIGWSAAAAEAAAMGDGSLVLLLGKQLALQRELFIAFLVECPAALQSPELQRHYHDGRTARLAASFLPRCPIPPYQQMMAGRVS